MGTKSVLIPGEIQATNIDSLVKFGKHTVEVENGNIVVLGALATGTRENEVYVAATPANATPVINDVYIVNEPINVVTDGKYTGLNDDPTNFSIAAGKVFTCFKPKVGDVITLSENAMQNAKSSNTHIGVKGADNRFEWVGNVTATTLGFKLLMDDHIEIPTGTFYDRTKKAYRFICVKA